MKYAILAYIAALLGLIVFLFLQGCAVNIEACAEKDGARICYSRNSNGKQVVRVEKRF